MLEIATEVVDTAVRLYRVREQIATIHGRPWDPDLADELRELERRHDVLKVDLDTQIERANLIPGAADRVWTALQQRRTDHLASLSRLTGNETEGGR